MGTLLPIGRMKLVLINNKKFEMSSGITNNKINRIGSLWNNRNLVKLTNLWWIVKQFYLIINLGLGWFNWLIIVCDIELMITMEISLNITNTPFFAGQGSTWWGLYF